MSSSQEDASESATDGSTRFIYTPEEREFVSIQPITAEELHHLLDILHDRCCGIQPGLMAPILGYWNARSLGQPIRNLLTYKGVEFEDKRYEAGLLPDNSESWLRDKFTLGLKYPNLPYYIDGDVKITESLAILRYLGRKHDLAARNEEETIELDMLEQRVRDLYLMLPTSGALLPKLKYSLESYAEQLDDFLGPWDEFLAERKWVMGDRMTYVDFLLYEALDWHREFKPEAVQRCPGIVQYLDRFETLPNIKEYFASDKYKRWPILSRYRPWGHRKPCEGDAQQQH